MCRKKIGGAQQIIINRGIDRRSKCSQRSSPRSSRKRARRLRPREEKADWRVGHPKKSEKTKKA